MPFFFTAFSTYDAWGNCEVLTYENDDIGQINPIRWKSHYYDKESGYYYLHGRYYDKEVAKFINATNIAIVFKKPYNFLILDRNNILCNNIIEFGSYAYAFSTIIKLHLNPEAETDAGNEPKSWWDNLHWGWKVGIAVGIVVGLAALTFVSGGIAGAAAGSTFSISAGFAALGAGFTGASLGTGAMATVASISGAAFASAAISSTVGFLGGGMTFTDGQFGWDINSAANGAVNGAITGAIAGGLGGAVSNVGKGLNPVGKALVQGGLNAAIAGGVTAANGLITGDFSWTSVGVASVFGFFGGKFGTDLKGVRSIVSSVGLGIAEASIGELIELIESIYNFNFLSVMPYNYV